MSDGKRLLFKALFQNLPNPVVIVRDDAPDYTIEGVNEAFQTLLGLKDGNVSGESYWTLFNRSLISAHAESKFREAFRNVTSSGETARFTVLKHQKATESRSFFRVEIARLSATRPAQNYFIVSIVNFSYEASGAGAWKDISELNEELAISNEELLTLNEELIVSQEHLQMLNSELEERVRQRTRALEESESRLSNILETLPQMAWTCTLEGKINFYNQQWRIYTGLDLVSVDIERKWYEEESPVSPERTYPRDWYKVIHPDDLQQTSNKFLNILRSGQGGEFEARFRNVDGSYRWHLSRLLPFRNKRGAIELWVGTATDIEDIKRVEQQKDDFISIASHELKTPITTLKASLQLMDRLKSNPTHEMLPKLIEQARKSVERVSALVEDLLNVRRLQHEDITLNKTKFMLSQLIYTCCTPIIALGKYKVQVNGETHIEVCADEHRMDQVVSNLLNNAVKYAPESEVITIDICKEGANVKVSFSDRGPGIPSEKLEHLFERYYRVNPSGLKASGLGLGLYISSEIIRQHNGEMGVYSEVGKGSTFWFTLPL